MSTQLPNVCMIRYPPQSPQMPIGSLDPSPQGLQHTHQNRKTAVCRYTRFLQHSHCKSVSVKSDLQLSVTRLIFWSVNTHRQYVYQQSSLKRNVMVSNVQILRSLVKMFMYVRRFIRSNVTRFFCKCYIFPSFLPLKKSYLPGIVQPSSSDY
jgi:hypothetical protein